MAERPSDLLKRLMRTSPLVRRALGASLALGLLSTVSIIVQASAVASALGEVFYHHEVRVTTQVVCFVVATVVRAVAVGLGEPVTARIAAPLRRDLRRRLMRRVLRYGPHQSVDATVQLATKGIGAIEDYVANYVPALVLATMAPLLFLGYLTWRDPLSGVIVVVSVGLLPVFMILLGLAAKEKMQERWDDQQRLAGYFGDVVRGMGVLKAHNRSHHAVAQLDGVGVALGRTTMATLKVAFLSSFALELLSSLATALVALVLGVRLLDGSLRLSVALAVLLVTPEVFLPLRRSAAQYHGSADGIAAASVLLDLVGDAPRGGHLPAPSTAPALALHDVTVATEGRPDTPRVSGDIPAGQLTVIRGASGSGKTTLLRSLIGQRDDVGGVIMVNGTDLGELDRDRWQSCIAYLPQDPRPPGSNAREVLAMGARDISDGSMHEVLSTLGLDLDLDRELGEGASALSAGQRRRLSLARCLLRQPLLLVLDEPTAHLDAASEAIVWRVICSLTMTRVVATHRDLDGDHVIEVAASRTTRA
ncbi:MAG: ATP-binding cassette domain-containing protein [Acidobacteria bacterium]|nr:ATP-binding cassette domain-containing protein [Acidobacteriota bacterium]